MTLGLMYKKQVTAPFVPVFPPTPLHVLPSQGLLGRYQLFLQPGSVTNYRKAEKHQGIDSPYL